jgi:hypothetical protein
MSDMQETTSEEKDMIKEDIRKALLEDEDGEDTDLLRDLVELLAGTAIRSLV